MRLNLLLKCMNAKLRIDSCGRASGSSWNGDERIVQQWENQLFWGEPTSCSGDEVMSRGAVYGRNVN
jgi:hypothetical protein